MSQHALTLDVVSFVSGFITDAESNDDVDKLAAVIAGCQLLETRAQNTLAGRVSQNIINDIKAAARLDLGPGW